MRPYHQPALLTDLYELTMSAAYFESGLRANASFELFVRRLPRGRNYLVAAGLEQALDLLETFGFEGEEVDFLRRQPIFARVSDGFFDYLRKLRFGGEIWAIPEGTPVFAEEPLLRVTGPIIEAQLVETVLLSVITFQMSIASKAARVVEAAQGREVVEFGTRRAHGPEAGVLAARAAYIGGCAGSSNVEAHFQFGVPSYGTQAHSFIMAYGTEEEAFRDFLRVFPKDAVLLVDTYDTLAAIDKIIALGLRPPGVRLDSGDLVELSRQVRQRLDRAGLQSTQIFASGDLDEFAIAELVARGAQIDAFGVGTALATSSDAPALSGVYKLVEMSSEQGTSYPAKFSPDKATYPDCKQVFRFRDDEGFYHHDVIARADEEYPEGEPLLELMMREGRRIRCGPALEKVRGRARSQLAQLPASYRALRGATEYPVHISPALQQLFEQVKSGTG